MFPFFNETQSSTDCISSPLAFCVDFYVGHFQSSYILQIFFILHQIFQTCCQMMQSIVAKFEQNFYNRTNDMNDQTKTNQKGRLTKRSDSSLGLVLLLSSCQVFCKFSCLSCLHQLSLY